MDIPETVIAIPSRSGNGFTAGKEYTWTYISRVYGTRNDNDHERMINTDTLLLGKQCPHLTSYQGKCGELPAQIGRWQIKRDLTKDEIDMLHKAIDAWLPDAQRVGSLHANWDLIFDARALIEGKQTLLSGTKPHVFNEIMKYYKEPKDEKQFDPY